MLLLLVAQQAGDGPKLLVLCRLGESHRVQVMVGTLVVAKTIIRSVKLAGVRAG